MAGTWVEQDGLLALTEFAEKPSLDYAEANLRVDGVADGVVDTVLAGGAVDPHIAIS